MDSISTLISRLKPDIIGIIEELGLTSGSGGTLAISGVLEQSQYPDALLRDGSRALLSSLAVAAGATIDGVDLDVFADAYTSHLLADSHAIYASADGSGTRSAYQAARLTKQVLAGSGLTGGGMLDADRTLNVGAGTGISVTADTVGLDLAAALSWTGQHQFQNLLQTQAVKPLASDQYDAGAPDRLWRRGYFSELDAVLFAENVTSVVGGRLLLCKNQGTSVGETSAVATSIDFGKALTPGDFVVFRAAGAVEYVRVDALLSGTTYTVTRNLDGSGANVWPAGSVYAVYGASGDYRIEQNADDSPRISLLKQGGTYNAAAEQFRLGDLNGNWGYGTATIGLAIGEYGANLPNITIDPTNGLRIRNHASTVLHFKTDGSAEITGDLRFAGGAGRIGPLGIYQNVALSQADYAFKVNNGAARVGGMLGVDTSTWRYVDLAMDTTDGTKDASVFVRAIAGTGDATTLISADGPAAAAQITLSSTTQALIALVADAITVNGTSLLAPSWAAPTLQNSWINYSTAGYRDPQYTKDATNTVRMRGLAKNGTIASGTIVAILPSGFRPPYRMQFPAAAGGNASVVLDIDTSGNIRLYYGAGNTPTNGYLSFDNVAFHTGA